MAGSARFIVAPTVPHGLEGRIDLWLGSYRERNSGTVPRFGSWREPGRTRFGFGPGRGRRTRERGPNGDPARARLRSRHRIWRAFAVMLAALHPATELVRVDGQRRVALHATENTLRVPLDHIGAPVPVFADASSTRPSRPADPAGVLDAEQPPFPGAQARPAPVPLGGAGGPGRAHADRHRPRGPARRRRRAGRHQPPLADVALAAPPGASPRRRVPRLVLMGGGARRRRNVTATGRVRPRADPSAGPRGLRRRVARIIVLPWTRPTARRSPSPTATRVAALGTPAGDAAAMFLRAPRRAGQTPDRLRASRLHPSTTRCVSRTDSSRRGHVSRRLPRHRRAHRRNTLGRLIVDTRPWSGIPVTATVASTASVEVFREVLIEAFIREPPRRTAPSSRAHRSGRNQGKVREV